MEKSCETSLTPEQKVAQDLDELISVVTNNRELLSNCVISNDVMQIYIEYNYEPSISVHFRTREDDDRHCPRLWLSLEVGREYGESNCAKLLVHSSYSDELEEDLRKQEQYHKSCRISPSVEELDFLMLPQCLPCAVYDIDIEKGVEMEAGGLNRMSRAVMATKKLINSYLESQ